MVFKFCLGNFGTRIMNVPAYFIFLLLLGGAPFYFGVSKTSLSEKKKKKRRRRNPLMTCYKMI